MKEEQEEEKKIEQTESERQGVHLDSLAIQRYIYKQQLR